MQCFVREAHERLQQEPGSRRLTLRDAAARQRVLMPAYPGGGKPVAICADEHR